ncbi:AdoMet-dependent rRNA methyltransferase spb1 [Nowakowskiella sp. JEL0407]|nr:AdoMet-dependent rRNA methyltransferase spb1 [Nowakowskiella sp. JEL0407]
MAIKKKYAKGRLDKYYHMAKEQGYRARSAFKLIQLNKKHNFLEGAKCLIDLCAAPGGWCQVAAKYMPKNSLIVGLDLAPIKPIPGVVTFVEDIRTSKCRSTLNGALKHWKADVVLHDGAPNVGTAWLQDAFAQSELTLASLKLATEFLAPGGTFVSKVFRSKDYNKLLWVLHQLFSKVEATKPQSSRNVSAEIFVVCRNFLAPKKIDPRLLDPKWVFKEMDDTPKDDNADPKKRKEIQSAILNDLFHPEKRKRHRDGYADGDYTLHTSKPVSEFITADTYVSILAENNQLKFTDDEICQKVLENPLTSQDIKECCADLKVLGKRDFKNLIKWREEIRISLGLDTSKSKAKKGGQDEDEDETMTDVKDEASLVEQLETEKHLYVNREKRMEKKKREKKAKQLLRLGLGMGTPEDIGLEAGGLGIGNDDGAVSEKPSRKQYLPKIDDDEDEYVDLDEGDDEEWEDNSDYDSDGEVVRKVGRLESEMDELYQDFKARQNFKERKSASQAAAEDAKSGDSKSTKKQFEEWYGTEWEKNVKKEQKSRGTTAEDDSDSEYTTEDDDSDAEMNENSDQEEDDVAVALAGKKRKREDTSAASARLDSSVGTAKLSSRAKAFFDNPLFKGMQLDEGTSNGSAGAKSEKLKSKEKKKQHDEDDETGDKEFFETVKKAKKSKKSKDSDDSAKIEHVPKAVAMEEDNDDDEDISNFAISTAAEYTIAQKLLTKSGKNEVVDNAYNRHAFNDPANLPAWFLEDEKQHNKVNIPVTKEAVEIMKARQLALDARPIKKVMEAKFRTKMRSQRKLEKLQKKAAILAEDDDMSEAQKLKKIKSLMSSAKSSTKKRETKVVVAKGSNRGVKGRPTGVKGRYKMVDPRMKKEMRAEKRRSKKKGTRRK